VTVISPACGLLTYWSKHTWDVLFHGIRGDGKATKRELGSRKWHRLVRLEPLEPRHLLSGLGPTITDDTATPALLNDANVGTAVLSVTVHFSETMDLATIPTLAFSPELAATLTFNAAQSAWADADTYVATYDVADAGVKVDNVTVDVTGAKDGAGTPGCFPTSGAILISTS
jgi:hypothetical protein